jgi:hypothetical protein
MSDSPTRCTRHKFTVEFGAQHCTGMAGHDGDHIDREGRSFAANSCDHCDELEAESWSRREGGPLYVEVP